MNAEKRSAKIYKTSIIQDIVEQGGDITTGYFPGSLTVVAVKHRVTTDTIREVWKCFCETGETSIKRFYGTSKHLQKEDIVVLTFETMNLAILVQGYIY